MNTYLVACSKSKRSGWHKAKDLYTGTAFNLASQIARREADQWFILSAKYGLLDPNISIADYNQSCNDLSSGEHRKWAERILLELSAQVDPGADIVILAGRCYFEHLIGPLSTSGFRIHLPLKGKKQGEGLKWLKENLTTYKAKKGDSMNRLENLKVFYRYLEEISRRYASPRNLNDKNWQAGLPKRGVYFFFEEGEERYDSGKGHRVVRVGTHATILNAKSTLKQRLGHHRGTGISSPAGGNHRGSVFRKHVGRALIQKRGMGKEMLGSWDGDKPMGKYANEQELDIEIEVSKIIWNMPFLVLPILDPPGQHTERSLIEMGSISLLSNFQKPDSNLDAPSPTWLGLSHPNAKIRESGLWNVIGVDRELTSEFLDILALHIRSSNDSILHRVPSSSSLPTSKGETSSGKTSPSLTNKEKVLHFIESQGANGVTNRDISKATGVKPINQVFQRTKELLLAGSINGEKNGKQWRFFPKGYLYENRSKENKFDKIQMANFYFQAQWLMSQLHGERLSSKNIDRFNKDFDLASEDEQILGFVNNFSKSAKEYSQTNHLKEISEQVWLLENTEAQLQIICFGGDPGIPSIWLASYSTLLKGVRFYFIDESGVLKEIYR